MTGQSTDFYWTCTADKSSCKIGRAKVQLFVLPFVTYTKWKHAKSVWLSTDPPNSYVWILFDDVLAAEASSGNDISNLDYMFPKDLVGPTSDMLDGGALLNCNQWPGDSPNKYQY